MIDMKWVVFDEFFVLLFQVLMMMLVLLDDAHDVQVYFKPFGPFIDESLHFWFDTYVRQ